MLTATLLFAILIGLAGWMPAPVAAQGSWLGFRFFHAGMALVVALYVGNVLLSVPLSSLAIIIGIVAAGGMIARFLRMRYRPEMAAAALLHPVFAFALLVTGVAIARNGISYLPYPGDEVASWLKLARQIFLVDAYWSDRIDYHLGAYTNGWPLLVAFANTLRGTWDDSNGALLPFLLHLGLLGLIYDLVYHAAQTRIEKPFDRVAISWLVVLGLLLIEASWILVPRFMLVDEPLSYVYIGCLITAIVGLQTNASRIIIVAYLGLSLAAGYLLKIAILAVVPSLGLFVLAYLWLDAGEKARAILRNDSLRRAVVYALLTLAPMIVVMVSWSQFKTGEHCNASPIDLLTDQSQVATAQVSNLLQLYWEAMLQYVATFKWPITIASAAALMFGLARRRLVWIVAGTLVFIVAYSAAHFLSYLSCLDAVTEGQLWSFQRYFRQNHRVLHVLGPVVLVLWALNTTYVRTFVDRMLAGRKNRAGLVGLIIVLIGLQAWSADRSLRDMASRNLQDPAVRDAIVMMKDESNRLRELIEREGLDSPNVSLIAQRGFGVEFELAAYFGLKDRRDDKSLFVYKPQPPYSWSDRARGPYDAVTSIESLRSHWRNFEILWPVRTDDWVKQALSPLAGDTDCDNEPERFFFFRSTNGMFRCVSKALRP